MKEQLYKKIELLKLTYYIAAFLALLGGMAIYAFFRDINNMLLFHFFPNSPFLNSLYFPFKADSTWSNVLLYNLTDGLWCLSGLLIIRAIWLTNIRWSTIYGGIFIAMVLSFEALQLSGNIPGTFDVLDLAFMGIFAFLESIIFKLLIRRRII